MSPEQVGDVWLKRAWLWGLRHLRSPQFCSEWDHEPRERRDQRAPAQEGESARTPGRISYPAAHDARKSNICAKEVSHDGRSNPAARRTAAGGDRAAAARAAFAECARRASERADPPSARAA